jgi:sec-independent protein translocase protein TatC
MALPMYGFYEVGILSAGFFNKKKPVSGGSGMPAVVTAAVGNGKAPSVGLPNVGEGDYVGVPTDRRR